MTQQQLDYLCINQQSSIGLRAATLVDYASTGDMSAAALAANLFASHAIMRSIKDVDVADAELTDQEMFDAQEKLIALENSDSTYY